jgi:hypothetical protein
MRPDLTTRQSCHWQTLPAGVKITTLNDASTFVSQHLHDRLNHRRSPMLNASCESATPSLFVGGCR